MTIKQQGGIFGRNPSFNDATVEDLTVTNSVSVPNDSISGNAINGGTATPTTLLVNTTTNPNNRNMRFYGVTEFDSAGATFVNFLTSNGATTLGTIGQGNYVVTGAPSNSFGIKSNVNLPIAAGGSAKVADFTVNGLAFPAGKGIDFSATSGTGTSELFSDYEEGEYTPTLTPFGSGSITLNSSYDKLAYTKIGRLVTVTGAIIVSSVSSPTGSRVDVSLPFTGANTSDISERCCGLVLPKSLGSVNNAAIAINGPSATVGFLVTVSSGTQSDIAATDFSGNEELLFTFSYIAA